MSTSPQELVSGHGIIPAFNLAGSFDILNLQAPAKEVSLSHETIDFLNNLGASGFEVTAEPEVDFLAKGFPTMNSALTNALLQLTVGVIGVIVSKASPQTTTTVMIKPERRGRFMEMAATLNNFAALAKEIIPNMRELTADERKDLKLFF